MASDRGTIPRNAPGGMDPQSSWNEPTLPAGRRMPSAPRERKPMLVLLALLLIVIGAGTAGVLVQRMNAKVGAIEISTTLQSGNPITAADLTEVQITASSGVSYVTWNSAAAVTKYFAAEEIPSGTLLTNKMVSRTGAVANGQDVLGLALKDGQMPDNLQVGEKVDIYSTSTTTTGCPGTPGHELATDATVLSITPGKDGSGDTDVEVALNGDFAGNVACNTANGTAAVAAVTGNG